MDWLSASIVAAVILFIIKEIFEAIRRGTAASRQIEAHKILFKRSCELNVWALSRLKDAIIKVEKNPKGTFSIEYIAGKAIFKAIDEGWQLPEVDGQLFKGALFDVATLQSDMFPKLEAAYDATLELQHVRTTFISFIDGSAERKYISGFFGYAKRNLDEQLVHLKALYRVCANGQELVGNGRVR